MQMKRTLGMLLALCFLMSVTVAAVGAVSTGSWTNTGSGTNSTLPVYPTHLHPAPPPVPTHLHPAPLAPVFKPRHGPIATPVFKPIAMPVFKPIAKPVFKPNNNKFGKVTYKLVKIPAHFETKKVKKFVGFKHGKKVYKTVTIKIFVHAKWIKVPVYNNHNNNHNNNHR